MRWLSPREAGKVQFRVMQPACLMKLTKAGAKLAHFPIEWDYFHCWGRKVSVGQYPGDGTVPQLIQSPHTDSWYSLSIALSYAVNGARDVVFGTKSLWRKKKQPNRIFLFRFLYLGGLVSKTIRSHLSSPQKQTTLYNICQNSKWSIEEKKKNGRFHWKASSRSAKLEWRLKWQEHVTARSRWYGVWRWQNVFW